MPQWWHDMLPTGESDRYREDTGTTPTQSTTHQSSYLQYDDDDSTIESLPLNNEYTKDNSSNSEEEETVHHRNLSFDEFPSHASNDTSNPFRNDKPHEVEQLPQFPDLLSTIPQQPLRRSSRLQAIPIISWDPITRIRNNVSHANQVALLSETAF